MTSASNVLARVANWRDRDDGAHVAFPWRVRKDGGRVPVNHHAPPLQ